MGDTSYNTAGYLGYRSTGLVKKRLLKRGNYLMVAAMFGQPFTQPTNTSLTGKWRRYENFPTAEAPLSEGVTPPGRKLTKTDITSTLRQYGDWAELTDVVFDTHEDDIPMETVDLCSEQMAETVELVTVSVQKSGSNVVYANNAGSRAAVNAPPLAGDFKRIERALSKDKAMKITSRIGASQLVSTEGVDPSYVVFGHTDCKADLENMEGYTPVRNYGDAMKTIHQAEAGALGSFRFLLTPLFEPWLLAATSSSGTTYLSNGDIPSSAGYPDVYPMIIAAKDSYGVVRLQGQNAVRPAMVKPRPVQGDPLGQLGFISWKVYYTAVILNSSWLVRYECAVTANPT